MKLKLVEDIDWSCDIQIQQNTINYGSHIAPKKAIDWLFENETVGIILEDDCIPNDSFFEYCSVLLDRYSEEDRVFMISGDNGGPIINQDYFNKNSYLFTKVHSHGDGQLGKISGKILMEILVYGINHSGKLGNYSLDTRYLNLI